MPVQVEEVEVVRNTGIALTSQSKPINLLAYVHLRNIHNSTGAGRTARQITEHLALRSDVNLRVLADRADAAQVLPLVQKPWTEYDYHFFERDTSRQQARWILLDTPTAERNWPEVDIVYCTGESYVPVRKARSVVTLHDASYFERGALTRDAAYWKTRIKWGLLHRKLDRKVDMFHTVSQFSAERLAHFFPAIASRIRPVYNGVTPRFFGPVSEMGLSYLEQVGLSTIRFLLVPGGLHFRKNAELILEAIPYLLQQFPDLVIAVVNHTNPVYAERAGIFGDRVHLLGFVSDDALHALYAAARVVWYPSRYEGFGLPIVEAMASGTPVVGSNSSSIPEIAGGAALLADPSDAFAHVEAIAALLTDERAHEEFSAAGRLRAQRFTWFRCAAELRSHFGTLL